MMTPLDLVTKIHNSIVDENLAIYKEIFSSTSRENASNPHWKRALRFYDQLADGDRELLFDVIRQVIVDTVSNLLAVLDGVSTLDGLETEFTLLDDSSHEQINGELQDRFLELEEHEHPKN